MRITKVLFKPKIIHIYGHSNNKSNTYVMSFVFIMPKVSKSNAESSCIACMKLNLQL